jgi:hypothetical protein
MGRRRDGLTLAERSRLAGVGTDAARSEARPDEPRRGEPRHCWVKDPPGHSGTWPGLVVEWRRREGWEARTVYLVREQGRPVLVEAWLNPVHLLPL